mgnify:CR=1 FL=1
MKKFMIIACLVLIACFVWGIDLTNDSGKQVQKRLKMLPNRRVSE